MPAFVAINAGTAPAPDELKPIAEFELVQAKVAPAGTLVKFTAAALSPLHKEEFPGTMLAGLALSEMV